jgi:hypothetical protein
MKGAKDSDEARNFSDSWNWGGLWLGTASLSTAAQKRACGREDKFGEDSGEVGLEAVEVGAEDAGLGEVIHALTLFFGADETGGFELFHVMGEGWGADVDVLAEVTTGGGTGLGAEFFQDLVTARVGEGAGDQLDLIFG